MLLKAHNTGLHGSKNDILKGYISTPARRPSPGVWQPPTRGDCMSDRTCTIDGCKNKFYAKDYCRKHWQWARSQGIIPTPKTCSINGCSDNVVARGWCNKHYCRWKFNGDPTFTTYHDNPVDSFNFRTEWQGDCLVWTGSVDGGGYGQIWIGGGKFQKVHRWAWEQEHGPIPDGMFIDHTCWNPPCANVEHLRLATPRQNAAYLQGADSGSKTGIRGVFYHKASNGYIAQVGSGESRVYTSAFSTAQEAEKAAVRLRKDIYGEFAGKG